jgi:RNA polymerase sigma-70 factor, ECF subfamily
VGRAELEAELSALLKQRELARAATLALEGYGSEIFSLIASLYDTESDAAEVFSIFCERLWRGLPGFAGRSSFRTWAYIIARNAATSFREQRAAKREELVTSSAFEETALRVRTSTWSRLRAQALDRFQRLREMLPPDDQMLLILRVERELDWKDLARAMAGDDALDGDALRRETARLRKRFQLVKERLRAQAADEGLLDN